MVNVRLPTDQGRLRGFGYVEFEDRQSLIDALGLNDEVKSDDVNVNLIVLCVPVSIELWKILPLFFKLNKIIMIVEHGRKEDACGSSRTESKW